MEPTLFNKLETLKQEPLLRAAPAFTNRPQVKISTPNIGNFTRIVLAILSVGMCLSFFYPLWDIALQAPQYPEGLSLQIWINKLSGNIATINGLNHYIGMRHIVPSDFSELQYMPYIVSALIIFGLIAAISKKKAFLYAFTFAIVVLGIVGAIDFYMWEYNYGHNLDPRAAIQIPGMNYQPPMIGRKELLNFVATAWPALGGISIIFAAIGAFALSIYEYFRKNVI